MKFEYLKLIYQTALDSAKEQKRTEIIKILSRILNEPEADTQQSGTRNAPPSHSTLDISQLPTDSNQLKELVLQLKAQNDQLESYLGALLEKPVELNSLEFSNYREDSVIGKGGQSKVKKIRKKEEYAKKELQKFDHKSLKRFLKESDILAQLRHPCIVRILGFDYGDSTHPPSIFLPLEPRSLEDSVRMRELTNKDKNRITVEIVLGMRYIHFKNFIHRDLKPSNILLSKNKHVRISDFGLAKEEDIETSQSEGVGTLYFMAPELFRGKNATYDNKVDVYSFGITLIYIIIEQYSDFDPEDKLNGDLPTLPSTIVPWVVELIHGCLQKSPTNRPTFNDIFEILKSHDFDLFNETKPSNPSSLQRQSLESIQQRILKIEAIEYQEWLSKQKANQ